MKRLLIGLIGVAAFAGCSSPNPNSARGFFAPVAVQKPEDDLNDEQRKVLEEWTRGIKTKNSVKDIDRLKDSLKRWDELFMAPFPPDMKPVYAILKDRVKERLAELEREATFNAK